MLSNNHINSSIVALGVFNFMEMRLVRLTGNCVVEPNLKNTVLIIQYYDNWMDSVFFLPQFRSVVMLVVLCDYLCVCFPNWDGGRRGGDVCDEQLAITHDFQQNTETKMSKRTRILGSH